MAFESSNQFTKISYYWVDRTLLVDPGNPVPTWSGHLSASLRVKSVPHRYKTGANWNTSRKHHWNMVRFMTHNYPSIPLFVVFPAAVNPITTRPRRFKVKMAGFPYTFSMWPICLFNLISRGSQIPGRSSSCVYTDWCLKRGESLVGWFLKAYPAKHLC